MEEAAEKLGNPRQADGACAPGFPRFPPVRLPVVVHAVQYVDSRNQVVSPPGVHVVGFEKSVRELVQKASAVLGKAGVGIQLSFGGLRTDVVAENHLLLPNFQAW